MQAVAQAKARTCRLLSQNEGIGNEAVESQAWTLLVAVDGLVSGGGRSRPGRVVSQGAAGRKAAAA